MAPRLPFPGYKWRFASLAPTEGLLDRDIILGCIRVAVRFEGRRASDPALSAKLAEVTTGAGTSVDLARNPGRNLLRNSQQYWKALALLETTSPSIQLTATGRRVALGEIAVEDWLADIVISHELPNRRIETPNVVAQWVDAGLRIRPFLAILQVMIELRRAGVDAYVTGFEFRRIVIPALGDGQSTEDAARHVRAYRSGRLQVEDWPDCQPEANDARMAQEFLVFLSRFGLLTEEPNRLKDRRRYSVPADRLEYVERLVAHAGAFVSPSADPQHPEVAASGVDEGGTRPPDDVAIERGRMITSVLARPDQAAFRRAVLTAAGVRCIVTGTTIAEVLEAAHIRGVSEGGSDLVENGLCLRRDIHALFDTGLIRIDEVGRVVCASLVRAQYPNLDGKFIELPQVVNRDALRRRFLET